MAVTVSEPKLCVLCVEQQLKPFSHSLLLDVWHLPLGHSPGVSAIGTACMQTWGSPLVALQTCISRYSLAAGFNSLPLDSSTSTFAGFSLNFKYPVAPAHKENRKLTQHFPLLEVSSPLQFLLVFVCSFMFSMVALIFCPEFVMVTSGNWHVWSISPWTEAELFLFVLNLGQLRPGVAFALLGDKPRQFTSLMRNAVY